MAVNEEIDTHQELPSLKIKKALYVTKESNKIGYLKVNLLFFPKRKLKDLSDNS